MRADTTGSQRLKFLLAQEAELLRAGRFAELPKLVARKEALVVELESGSTTLMATDAEALRSAVLHSERLLGAALRGAKAARARHAAVTRAAAGLETYDRSGQRNLLGHSAGRLEKRA